MKADQKAETKLPGLLDADYCYQCEKSKDDCTCHELAPDEERDAYLNESFISGR